MNRLPQILALLRSRNALIAIAVSLVVLNIGRLATDQYHDYLQGIESKRALLGQYQIATRDIETLRQRIQRLDAQKNAFDSHLFVGANRDEITSAMQIKVQEMLGAAGLSPESLHPTERRGDDKDKLFGEVIIKVRISGELEQFLHFMAELYKLEYLFKINNLTVKPYKKKELKVFLELKGFYKVTSESGNKA